MQPHRLGHPRVDGIAPSLARCNRGQHLKVWFGDLAVLTEMLKVRLISGDDRCVELVDFSGLKPGRLRALYGLEETNDVTAQARILKRFEFRCSRDPMAMGELELAGLQSRCLGECGKYTTGLNTGQLMWIPHQNQCRIWVQLSEQTVHQIQ